MSDFNDFQKDFFNRLGPGLHLGKIFEQMPEVYYFAKDVQSRFVDANMNVVRMSGCQRLEELIGLTDFDVHPMELAARYIEEDQRVMLSRKPLPNQAWLVPDRGKVRWFISTKMPLFAPDGQIIGIAGVMRDHKKSGEMLQPFSDMQEVVDYIFANYDQKITLEILAEQACLSVSQLIRNFKKVFDTTPQQFILKVRLDAACQLLVSTDMTVSQIAQQTGFYDHSYFAKQFVQGKRVSPKVYRRKYRK